MNPQTVKEKPRTEFELQRVCGVASVGWGGAAETADFATISDGSALFSATDRAYVDAALSRVCAVWRGSPFVFNFSDRLFERKCPECLFIKDDYRGLRGLRARQRAQTGAQRRSVEIAGA